MTRSFPVAEPQLDSSELPPGPLPNDLSSRFNLLRSRLPEALRVLGAPVDVPAPDVSAAAVRTSAVGTYDFDAAEFPDLKILLNDYPHRNNAPGSVATHRSGLFPALATVNAASDTIKVSIAGEATQEIDLGTVTGGANVAAAFQAAVRALTAASARNQRAYSLFTMTYSPPSFSTTLTKALASGVEVNEIEVDTVQGLRRGSSLRIMAATVIEVRIIEIFGGGRVKKIRTQKFTPGALISAGTTVQTADDYYESKTGKRGADMSLVYTDGAANSAADNLKLRAADGIVSSSGTDNVGPQTISFEAADFVDPALATAAEVVVVINRTLTAAVASVNGGAVRITTDRLGIDAKVLVFGDAAAASLLNFPATEAVGTETEVALNVDTPEIVAIQPYVESTGALLDLIVDPLSFVRVRRDHLVNRSSVTDFSNAGANRWLVYFRLSGTLSEV